MNLSVLYRGPLASCNYACGYCPFSKRKDTASQLERDRAALVRFTQWIADQTGHRWRILLTPWGEALVRSWYRDAIARLTHVPHLDSVAAQTNLSCGLDWLAKCRLERLSLWATYHPTQTTADRFLDNVTRIVEQGVRISVGVVGVPESLPDIVDLHSRLPAGVYLWVNAEQPRRRPYTADEVARFTAIDPQFHFTLRRQASFGRQCQAGLVSFTVDGGGAMRRCHFVDEVIGNCYVPGWEQALVPRPCPNRFCDCFLGQSQLLTEALSPFFGRSPLERLPVHALGLQGFKPVSAGMADRAGHQR